MVGITAVATIAGLIFVQTVIIEAEEDLNARFSQLEAKFTVLEHRLQKENEKWTQHLQEENGKWTQRLQEENEKWTQRLQQEEEKGSGLKKQVELLRRQLENVTDDVMGKFKRHGRHQMLTPNRRQSRSTDPDEVAFTAELTHELSNVPIHTILRFDHSIHWTGDSYDTSTGVFTCPTSGLYLFAVFIESNSINTESIVQLLMDGTPYMSVISERSDVTEDDTSGNVVLLPVNKGQRIWVETATNDNQSFWKLFTAFSGVLIHRH